MLKWWLIGLGLSLALLGVGAFLGWVSADAPCWLRDAVTVVILIAIMAALVGLIANGVWGVVA